MALVLIVDDSNDGCEVLGRVLRMHGHTTACAHNGLEALAAMAKARPAVVLLDVEMPEMDGIGFLEAVRDWGGWHTLPVILLTGVEDESCVERAVQLGVERVFRKGRFDPNELLACIAEIVQRNRDANAES